MDQSSEVSLLEEGETLKGRWTVSGRIGGGGFGQIYEAFDRISRESVAIKVEPRNAAKPVLRMEVTVLKRLHGSPYSCTYFGCGRTDHINYLVMQMQGKNLSELRRAQPDQKFSVSTSLRLVYEALHCIEAVHAEGFLHRDVKPSNFAMGATKETSRKVFVLDFGLARHYVDAQGRLRVPRSSVGFRGTVRYSSINAHREKELGRHDDLISLFYMAVELTSFSMRMKSERAPRNVVFQNCHGLQYTPVDLKSAFPGVARQNQLQRKRYIIYNSSTESFGEIDDGSIKESRIAIDVEEVSPRK